MSKLLSANWTRLRMCRAVWISLAGVFLLSVLVMRNNARSVQEMAESGFIRTLDSCYFAMAPSLGALFAVFISLFLGAEFADGTVRNKLIVGHSRSRVYLAGYFVCLGTCLALAAAWFLGGLPGLLWIGPFSMGPGEILAYLLVAAGFTASFAALFTMVGVLSRNKALTVVLSLAVWFGLFLLANAFYDRLNEPEMSGGIMYENGAFREVAPAPNPMYLAGTARTVCTWILELLPAGQTQLMRNLEIASPVRQIILSVLWTCIFLWAGIRAFEKKDIK